jgi:hypothetical protein
MSRTITAVCTAATCAIAVIALQPQAAAAQAKPTLPARTSVPAKPAPPATPSLTLTGCLHADGAKFMLSDMPENQTPKGRNWKTAYVMKTGKDVEVTPASSSVKLKDHVGHKIAITGVRNGDETHFTARAIKHVAATCS